MKRNLLFAAILCMAAGATAQEIKKDTLTGITITSRYYRKYKLDHASNTLKIPPSLQELPQNIQEIDKSIILDQQSININESVTRNVSGAMRNNTADFYGPFIFMRGAAINTLRNGTDLSMIYYGPLPEDAAIIDRLEFIKGPAGFVNAIGDPAGSFNIVTKQPTGTPQHQVSITTGSFDLYRTAIDMDGNLDKQQKWQYRLNAVGQMSRSFERFAFNDKVLVAPVLRYNINDHSSITAEYIYQQQSFLQYLLTVFSPYGFASLPRDFSIADPNKEPVKANEHNTFLTYFNQINEHWSVTAKATFAKDHMDGNYFFVSKYDTTTPNLIYRRVTYERFNTAVYAFQAYVNGAFKTGGLQHKVLGGIDANRKELLAYSGYNDPNANQALYALDVLHPVYGITFDSNKKTGRLEDIATNKQRIEYYAGYLQDEIHLPGNKWRITIAGRVTSSKSSITIPTTSAVSDLVVTPRAGLSYSIMPDMTAYALYDQTYTPQSGISANGDVFKPLKGKNREVGIKKDWLHGKWNTTISAYYITRDNIIVSDPATNLQSQIGQTQSKGIEFDMKGEIVKGLNVVINYAYTDAHVSDDANAKNIGLSSPYRIKHIQNTWLNYKLPKGFSISGGYQLQAGRAGRYPQDGDIHLNNVWRIDGGLGWSNGHLSINGIINNITNRFNYGSAWTRPTGLYAYVPFPPREFRLTAAYNF